MSKESNDPDKESFDFIRGYLGEIANEFEKNIKKHEDKEVYTKYDMFNIVENIITVINNYILLDEVKCTVTIGRIIEESKPAFEKKLTPKEILEKTQKMFSKDIGKNTPREKLLAYIMRNIIDMLKLDTNTFKKIISDQKIKKDNFDLSEKIAKILLGDENLNEG